MCIETREWCQPQLKAVRKKDLPTWSKSPGTPASSNQSRADFMAELEVLTFHMMLIPVQFSF